MTPMKSCERCGQTYPATDKYYGSNFRRRDGLALYCRQCAPTVLAERRKRKAERSKAWAKANPDKVRDSQRRSWERTRRERLAYLRRYRAANKERLNEYARQYRERARQQVEVI
jgi:hypothetical protein